MFSKNKFYFIGIFIFANMYSCRPPGILYSVGRADFITDSIIIHLIHADAFATGSSYYPTIKLFVENRGSNSFQLRIVGLESEAFPGKKQGTIYALVNDASRKIIAPNAKEELELFFSDTLGQGDTLMLNFAFDKTKKVNHLLVLSLLLDQKAEDITLIPIKRKKPGKIYKWK